MHSFVAGLVAARSDPFPGLPYKRFVPPIIAGTIKTINNAPACDARFTYLPPCFIHSSILKKKKMNVNGFLLKVCKKRKIGEGRGRECFSCRDAIYRVRNSYDEVYAFPIIPIG
jgi:hypothetical protein